MIDTSTRTAASIRSLARWIVALPLIMVGSLFYWSLALSLGGVSLMRMCSMASGSTDAVPQVLPLNLDENNVENDDGMASLPSDSPILVHLEESAEPEDVNDNAGAGGFVVPQDRDGDRYGDQRPAFVPGPGSTSY